MQKTITSENVVNIPIPNATSIVRYCMTLQWSSQQTILALVRKIIASRALARSERLARFLEFTVTETLAGNADQLKEFVIGVEVFARTRDYDPRLDPIVRVEARRLRMKLRKYYETEGREDRLHIEFPKGCYVPSFSPYRPEDRAAESTRHAIAVLPFQSESGSDPAAVAETLIAALVRLESIRVVACNTPFKTNRTPRDYARLRDQLSVTAVLEGSLRPANQGRVRLAVRLVDVRDGAYLWADSFERSLNEISSVRDSIAAALDQALLKLAPPQAAVATR
jgi:TolB-like protein